MAISTIAKPAPFGAITAHRFVSVIEHILIEWADKRAERRTQIQLHSLSDDLLNDIGISRWDIDSKRL